MKVLERIKTNYSKKEDAMIGGISLQNFKAFSDLPSVKFKPISVICGTNSSGKSTILQSILMLKQTSEAEAINQSLILDGKYVKLGNIQNVAHKKNLNNQIGLEVNFEVDIEDTRFSTSSSGVPLRYYLRDFIRERFEGDASPQKHLIALKFSVAPMKRNRNRVVSRPSVVKHMSVSFATKMLDGSVVAGVSIDMAHIKANDYLVKWSGLVRNTVGTSDKFERNGEDRFSLKFNGIFPVVAAVANFQSQRAVTNLFHRLTPVIQHLLSLHNYIGPLREEPSRRYIFEDQLTEIGNKGENAPYIFLDKCKIDIKGHFFMREGKYAQASSINLENAVARWFDTLGVKGFHPENKEEIVRITLDSSSGSNTKVTIADVGFGVSQIFPIILQGLLMPKGGTLMLEQPEIHLHPKLQMDMTDYFICLALSGRSVFVETHSDHIVNRLVRRIVEDESQRLSSLIGIYFIRPGESGSTVSEIQIDDTSGITNWPENFFDQNANESEQIIRAGIAKRKKARKDA